MMNHNPNDLLRKPQTFGVRERERARQRVNERQHKIKYDMTRHDTYTRQPPDKKPGESNVSIIQKPTTIENRC